MLPPPPVPEIVSVDPSIAVTVPFCVADAVSELEPPPPDPAELTF